ncbi:MAG: hypothetical protein QM783_02000 [Phycisphaerales bacterium]
MPPRTRHSGRKRRLFGWTLLALGLMTAITWFTSRWFYSAFAIGTWSAQVECGALEVWHSNPPVIDKTTWFGNQPEGDREWWFLTRGGRPQTADAMLDLRLFVYMHETDINNNRSTSIAVMLWPFPLLMCTCGGLLLRSGLVMQRRAATGRCVSCGYSTSGLASNAKCPECGKGMAGA